MKTFTCPCKVWIIGRALPGTMPAANSNATDTSRIANSARLSRCCFWSLQHCTSILQPIPCCIIFRRRFDGNCWGSMKDGGRESKSCSGKDRSGIRRINTRRDRSLQLLLHKLCEGSDFAVVQADAARLGSSVRERNLQLPWGRIHFPQFHGSAGHILRLIVGRARGNILVHDQGPVFPVGDYINAIRADRDGCVVKADSSARKQRQRTPSRKPHFAVARFVLGANGAVVAHADLLVVVEVTEGSGSVRSRILLLSEGCVGNQQLPQNRNPYRRRTHVRPPPDVPRFDRSLYVGVLIARGKKRQDCYQRPRQVFLRPL